MTWDDPSLWVHIAIVLATCWAGYELWQARHVLRSLLVKKRLPTPRERRVGFPYRERLDGELEGVGRTAVRFYRDGHVYVLHGDTHYAALEAISDWMDCNPGADPFTLDERGRLRLRSGIDLPKGTIISVERAV